MLMLMLVLVLVLGLGLVQRDQFGCIQRQFVYGTSITVLQVAFDYEHEHRFTEHEQGAAKQIHRYKSKPATKNPEEPFHLAFIE